MDSRIDSELFNQAERLYKLLYTDKIYSRSIYDICSEQFMRYSNRDSFLDIDSYMQEHKLTIKPEDYNNGNKNIITFIKTYEFVADLVLEICSIIKREELYAHASEINQKFENILKQLDSALLKLGYKPEFTRISHNQIQIKIVSINLIDIETIKDKTLNELIRSYNPNDSVGIKSSIISGIAKYLEGYRTELCKLDSGLCTMLFAAYNNLDIRHNNKTGKHKNKKLDNISTKEISELYDTAFNLSKIACYMIEAKQYIDKLNELSKK